ncbi:4Fe-4S binding protein [bacterium]|nr:4Fe-4S binding protein [bacterium]
MAKVVINETLCKGCSLCVSVCPVQILTLKQDLNAEGYHPVSVTEMEKCTLCLSCALMCPDTAIEIWR